VDVEGTPVEIDRAGVDNCFGCSVSNEGGLHLRFQRRPDGSVEVRHRAAVHHEGATGVVHGGIQATILDEVMGVTAQLALPDDAGDAPCVTVELQLRYRRPVPMAEDVVARARVERVDVPDIWVEGEIVGPGGELLTTATSRWRQLRPGR
jgi:uncharacterized protein (TIGR00369 family)